MSMTIRVKMGVIYVCQDGFEDKAIGSVFDNASFEEIKAIECGSDILPVVQEFISDVNSGSMKPRSAVKEFERILMKYDK